MNIWNSINELEVIRISPRMGRPKSENPKSFDLKVRVDKATKEKIDNYCVSKGINVAEFIRQAISQFLGK